MIRGKFALERLAAFFRCVSSRRGTTRRSARDRCRLDAERLEPLALLSAGLMGAEPLGLDRWRYCRSEPSRGAPSTALARGESGTSDQDQGGLGSFAPLLPGLARGSARSEPGEGAGTPPSGARFNPPAARGTGRALAPAQQRVEVF
jgi:hypothetical protein